MLGVMRIREVAVAGTEGAAGGLVGFGSGSTDVCAAADDGPSLLGVSAVVELSDCVSSGFAAGCANFASLLFLIYQS